MSRTSERNASHAFRRVDEDRKAEAESDDRDARRVAEPEDEDRRRHDRDRGYRSQALEEWIERAPGRVGRTDEKPEGDTDRRRDGEAGGVAASCSCPTSDRKSDVGHTSQARSATSLAVGTRNESSAPAQSCQIPRTATKTSDAERRPGEAARGGSLHCADRSSPAQNSVRRLSGPQPDVDAEAEQS